MWWMGRAPFTDQMFFHKYLVSIAPTIAHKILFRSKSLSNDNIVKKYDINSNNNTFDSIPKSLSINENIRGSNVENIVPKVSIGLGLVDKVQETINNVNKNSIINNNRLDSEITNSGSVFIV